MNYTRYSQFKLFMDMGLLEQAHNGRGDSVGAKHDNKTARECYRLYLRELYHYLTCTLDLRYRNDRPSNFLDYQRVQFVFSIPTIWGTQPIRDFEQAIRDAKFGSVPGHIVLVGHGLTEADAAAVYTMETLKEENYIKVCFLLSSLIRL